MQATLTPVRFTLNVQFNQHPESISDSSQNTKHRMMSKKGAETHDSNLHI